MSTAFVRQLGAEAGVQLNPLRDDSEIPTQDNYDQVIATALKATRGRIDKPFKVNRSNIARLLGVGQPTRINQLNESYLHVAEALNKGAYEVVVQRLVHNDPSPNYIVVKHGSGAVASAAITAGAVSDVTITQGGSGYTSAATISFSGGGGTGASATLTIKGGKVVGVTNLVGGSGYTTPPDAKVDDGGSGAQARVGTKDGVITKINLTSGGSGYTGTTTASITDNGGTGTGATATVTKSNYVITGITMAAAFGTGFTTKSRITVDNGDSGGTGLKLDVAKVNKSGAITSITILSGGSGYTGAPTIKVDGKAITGISFKKSQNVITGITVTNGGEGYTNPVVSFSGTPAVAAIASAVVRNNVIDTITVVNGGSGYPAKPTVTIGKGTSNGSGAKATATTANNVITAIEVTAGGTGYTNGAAVTGTFSGGGGTGATAKAVVSGGAVVSVEITNGGSSYTSTPTLTFPTGTGATFAFTKKNGVLKSITVTDGGSNYVGSKVRIEEGGGNGAIAKASLVSAPLTGITVVESGSNYYDPPKIEILGGGGSGAAATAVLANDGTISEITLDSAGSGYTVAPDIIIKDVTSFDVGDTDPPDDNCLFAVKHLECFNEGIKIGFWADEKRSLSLVDNTITTVNNDKITVWIRDVDDKVLYEFSGSLKEDALDDFGHSAYLPNVVSAMTDAVEIVVGTADYIPFRSSAYGYDDNGLRNVVESDPDKAITYFAEEDGKLYFEDYAAARVKLQLTPHNYAYICNCGNEDDSLIEQFSQLAFDTNRQFKIDVGSESPDPDAAVNEVIRTVERWGLGSKPGSHLLHVYWTRFTSADPTGINPKASYGTATLNAAYACARNAQTNARGFAPKNYPIAGRNWPVSRSGVVHDPGLTSQNLNALARAKINPVMFETYTGGGRSVFRDSLTSALVDSSLKKLTAVADMSTSIDDAVTRFAKDILQLPMDVAVKRTADFLKTLFEGAQTAGWIVPSSDPDMGGKAFKYLVKPNDQRPYDRLDIEYSLRYDGCVRAIYVTQTLSK